MAALQREQLDSGDQLPAFADMGAYSCIEGAPLARVSAVGQPVRVAARRAAFGRLYRRARKFFV
jgi:hypothetical protein